MYCSVDLFIYSTCTIHRLVLRSFECSLCYVVASQYIIAICHIHSNPPLTLPRRFIVIYGKTCCCILARGSGSQFPIGTIFYFLLITERGSGSPPVSYSVGIEGVFLDKETEACYLYPVFVVTACTGPIFIAEKLQLYWVQYGRLYKRLLSSSVL